jgi:cell division protein FtsB
MTEIRQLSGFFGHDLLARTTPAALGSPGRTIQERAMSLGHELKRRARIMVAPAIFLAITGYFGWNSTQGDRGLVAYGQRQDLLRQVVAEQTAAKIERDGWEIRVSGLRARHLDPDTLNERARSMLNLAEPSDVIVKLSPQEKLF